MRVFYTPLIIILFLSALVRADDDPGKKARKASKTLATDFARNYVPVLETAKTITLAVAEAMPKEKYTYKPMEISKTFGQQMVHIAYTITILEETHIQGKELAFQEPSAEGKSKEEIKNMLVKAFDQLIASAKAISSQDLKTPVNLSDARVLSKQYVYVFIHDHLTNHRAKANLYVRMNGIEPPAYGF
ncbi:DinB family protein [Fulvivirgaceae bacterium BMA12]|uniref:DinB family protein n=1 Tax=Agaribacillus aureus TaxID=3051825 RepID=A0ABT8L9V0_9BACT|nr:DinB family protein [Fulvivirgaceae bacterium BMA12]